MDKICELKPAKTLDEQIDVLKEHGMVIDDNENAKKILSRINYYRFKAYGLGLRLNDRYYNGVTFERIYEIYKFDKYLRNSLREILESIEISLRTNIAYNLSIKYGPEAHLNTSLFKNERYHNGFLKKLQDEVNRNSKELFIKHHIEKYNGRFPIWVILEVASFGTLSKMYSNLNITDQKLISRSFCGLNNFILTGGLPNISHVRNICAHHGKLYNTKINIIPKLHKKYEKYDIDKTRIFASILVIKELIISNNETEWKMFVIKLESLIESSLHAIDLNLIGFIDNWKEVLEL